MFLERVYICVCVYMCVLSGAMVLSIWTKWKKNPTTPMENGMSDKIVATNIRWHLAVW